MTTHPEPVRFHAPAFPVEDSLHDPVRDGAAIRHDAGYEAGYAAGLQAAEIEIAAAIAAHEHSTERLVSLSTALERATIDLASRDHVALAEIEGAVVELAVELAEAIVGRELSTTGQPVVDALARVVEFVPDRGVPTVRVNPADAEAAREAVAADVVRWTDAVQVVPDERVEPGGCVVDIGACRIDGQIRPALDRMRSVLVSNDGTTAGGEQENLLASVAKSALSAM